MLTFNLFLPADASLETAIGIAAQAHHGQVDKQGQPYILHILEVIRKCKTPDGKIVAALHDVAEDTQFSVEDIAKGFPPHIIEALRLLTRKKSGQSYESYILGLADNPLCVEVKIADLEHNTSRLDNVEPGFRVKKIIQYGKALSILGQGDKNA